jgi:uncharacterized membrane protein
MSYKPTVWVDDVPGIQTGTPQSADNFNNIEQGTFISNAIGAVTSHFFRLLQDRANENEVIAISGTITGANTDLSVVIPANKLRNRTTYNVTPVIVSTVEGAAGDIIVSAKQANGFKVKYTGAATSVNVILNVQGGML